MSDDPSTWYALRPEGRPAGDERRYRQQAEAEQAATAMLVRQPELQFIEIGEYELRDHEPYLLRTVGRIAAAQPPAPSAAEVDDLHLLPRGDPEL